MLIDTVHFTATSIPQDSVSMYGGDTLLCFDNVATVNVNGPPGYTFYLWNDGATTQSNSFNGPGIKWVYAQKLCYLLIDTFSVSAQPTDTSTGVTDTMICFSNSVTLSATNGYDSYLWSDGTATQANTFTQTDIKEVYAHKACAERIDTFNVTFINDLSVDLGPDTSICKGETVTLDATSNNYPNAQYLWQDGKTAAVYHVSEGGDYSVKVSVGPCTVSDTIRAHQKIIDIDLGKGLIPCHEESITLDAGVDSATYLWQDGSTQRTIKATKAGGYSVKVTQGDCSATASVEVKYEGCPCNVIIPTAFSPNNDNKNDKFGVTLSCDIQSFRLMIYNRWGNQVFYSEDINNKWDGTSKGIALDGDVFDYYAEFKDGEGKVYYYKGTVTLVR
jgi:gliding motility-associated-like protein